MILEALSIVAHAAPFSEECRRANPGGSSTLRLCRFARRQIQQPD
jgi:hypothetical protein